MVSDVEIYAFINESLSNESIPLSLENVEAGFPLPNGGQIDKRLDVNAYLLDHPKATIAFTVSGESMVDAGILPGDIVLVDTMKEANDGDVVVASVDNEYTIKELRIGPPLQLLPKNQEYSPIRLEDGMEVKILGPVVSVIRKYK